MTNEPLKRLDRKCPIGLVFRVQPDFPGERARDYALHTWGGLHHDSPEFVEVEVNDDSTRAKLLTPTGEHVWSARIEHCAQSAFESLIKLLKDGDADALEFAKDLHDCLVDAARANVERQAERN